MVVGGNFAGTLELIGPKELESPLKNIFFGKIRTTSDLKHMNDSESNGTGVKSKNTYFRRTLVCIF